MKQIKMCVFDMDGVLIDSESVYLINAKRCNDIYHFNINNEVLHATMGSTEKDCRRLFEEILGKDFPYDDFSDKQWALQQEYMKQHPLQLKKGVIELLDYLTQNKIIKVIATSTSRNYACKCLKDVGIYDYFDYIVCGDDLQKSKPNPDIYLKAISPYNFTEEEILVFEDSNNGILSGCNANLKVIYVPDVAIVPQDTQNKAYVIIEDLSKAIDIIENLKNK